MMKKNWKNTLWGSILLGFLYACMLLAVLLFFNTAAPFLYELCHSPCLKAGALRRISVNASEAINFKPLRCSCPRPCRRIRSRRGFSVCVPEK